jgi:hypothetical protein
MRTTTWSPGLVLGRCLGYGALSGALSGMAVLFVMFAVDGGIDSVVMAVAATAVYAPVALVVGCLVGLVDGVVVAIVLVLLGQSLQDHVTGARLMTGFVAALPPVVLLWSDFDLVFAVGCIAASALGAAFWTRRILGMMAA